MSIADLRSAVREAIRICVPRTEVIYRCCRMMSTNHKQNCLSIVRKRRSCQLTIGFVAGVQTLALT